MHLANVFQIQLRRRAFQALGQNDPLSVVTPVGGHIQVPRLSAQQLNESLCRAVQAVGSMRTVT